MKKPTYMQIESQITGMDIFPSLPKTPIVLPRKKARKVKKNKKST
tara:strand:- start:12728 stop:12862 length:135 start_codon:yes stop_codon:yes gene_type:complete